MVGPIFKFLSMNSVNSRQIRSLMTRGKSPLIARSLKERLTEMKVTDFISQVNIGFTLKNFISKDYKKSFRKEIKGLFHDSELEKLSRKEKLIIDLEQAKEEWLITSAPLEIYKIVEHYGIYKDLYINGYFYPIVPLTIDYHFSERVIRVYRGNLITSYEASKSPSVTYKSEPNSLWTLLLTTPDGNLSDPKKEYCHWFVGNIPGNNISNGEQLIDYIRPFPAKGIGYCRYIFVLYKQHEKIDFSEFKKEQPCLNLIDRNWKTYDFMVKYQDYLTPAGLAFFQTDYDNSLKKFYHTILNMKLPVFKYDFLKPYIKPQVWFPKKEPFNLYMDKYRDPKKINKEFLLKKLKKEHPFKLPDPPLKYPNAYPIKNKPSWLIQEIKKERRGIGRIKEIE